MKIFNFKVMNHMGLHEVNEVKFDNCWPSGRSATGCMNAQHFITFAKACCKRTCEV